jgi:predicted RND superfamily exporter protein
MKRHFRLGEFVLSWRLPIGAILLLTSAIMAYFVTKVQIRTRFVDFFPARHLFVSLNRKFARFGGANTLILVLETRRGDIFNHPFLQKIHDVTKPWTGSRG